MAACLAERLPNGETGERTSPRASADAALRRVRENPADRLGGSACGHMAGLPMRLMLDRLGELYLVNAAMMKLRCTACNQRGQVTTRLARLCDPGCRHWKG